MNRVCQNQQGYSLIEALIAAAILAGLATVLAPAIRASLMASGRIAAFGSQSEDARIGQDVLAELFAAAVNPGTASDAPAFSGGPRKLELTALFDMEAGPQTVSLAISDGKLICMLPANAHFGADQSAGGEIVLLEDASGFRFYGRENDRDTPDWRLEWTSETPPALVEIRRTDGARETPPLTFAIASSAPIHCLFDQVSRKCRK